MSGDPAEYGDGHTHEALHTVSVLIDTFERHVVETRCAEQFPDVKTLADEVAEKMADLYQLIGSKWP